MSRKCLLLLLYSIVASQDGQIGTVSLARQSFLTSNSMLSSVPTHTNLTATCWEPAKIHYWPSTPVVLLNKLWGCDRQRVPSRFLPSFWQYRFTKKRERIQKCSDCWWISWCSSIETLLPVRIDASKISTYQQLCTLAI
jgi:hypothetical protein